MAILLKNRNGTEQNAKSEANALYVERECSLSKMSSDIPRILIRKGNTPTKVRLNCLRVIRIAPKVYKFSGFTKSKLILKCDVLSEISFTFTVFDD